MIDYSSFPPFNDGTHVDAHNVHPWFYPARAHVRQVAGFIADPTVNGRIGGDLWCTCARQMGVHDPELFELETAVRAHQETLILSCVGEERAAVIGRCCTDQST